MSIDAGAGRPPEITAAEKLRAAELARMNVSGTAGKEQAQKHSAEFAQKKPELIKSDLEKENGAKAYMDTLLRVRDVQSAWATIPIEDAQQKQDIADWFDHAIDQAKDLKNPKFDEQIANDPNVKSEYAPLLSILGPLFAQAHKSETNGWYEGADPQDKKLKEQDRKSKNAFLQTAKKLFPDVRDNTSNPPETNFQTILKQVRGNELLSTVGAAEILQPATNSEQLKRDIDDVIEQIGRRVGDARQFSPREGEEIVENPVNRKNDGAIMKGTEALYRLELLRQRLEQTSQSSSVPESKPMSKPEQASAQPETTNKEIKLNPGEERMADVLQKELDFENSNEKADSQPKLLMDAIAQSLGIPEGPDRQKQIAQKYEQLYQQFQTIKEDLRSGRKTLTASEKNFMPPGIDLSKADVELDAIVSDRLTETLPASAKEIYTNLQIKNRERILAKKTMVYMARPLARILEVAMVKRSRTK